MALIKCSECGNEISDKAKVCVHCGAKTTNNNKKIIIIALVLLIIAIIIYFGFIKKSNNPISNIINQSKYNDFLGTWEIVEQDNSDILESYEKIDISAKYINLDWVFGDGSMFISDNQLMLLFSNGKKVCFKSENESLIQVKCSYNINKYVNSIHEGFDNWGYEEIENYNIQYRKVG